MTRTKLLIALLVLYVAVLGRGQAERLFVPRHLDPFAPRPKAVEQLIVARRFAEALPLAAELHANYPHEPLVSYWLATVNHGLNRAPAEAAAWTDFVRVSKAPGDACPAWPEALSRAGQVEQARGAFDRCRELQRP